VHRLTRLGLLMLSLALITILLAACGSADGTSTSTKSPPAPKTYTNDQYGFTMTYDGRFEEGPATDEPSAAGGNVFQIAFPDENGPTVNDTYADGLQVNVYKLPRSVKPAEVPALKKDIAKAAKSIVASLPGGGIEEPVDRIVVNGVPGFTFGYSYVENDTPVRATSSFLYKGQYQYTLTGQATSDTWHSMQPQLESTLESFTIQ
jgi:hypothetical protein